MPEWWRCLGELIASTACLSIAPTWLGRVNRPWHRPCPSSAIVNRHASSASASWRCSALSSWSSAISGATTSRTCWASRRSATGSCAAAQTDQVGLGLAAVLDRQRVDTRDDHRGLLLGHLSGGHRVPDRFVVVVQGVGQGEAAFGVAFGLPGCVGPPGGGVGGTGLGAELVDLGAVQDAELEGGDPGLQPVQRGEGLGDLGARHRPEPDPGDLVQVGLGGGDRGRHRVPGEVVEYRCHTGNSGIGHRQSRAWNGVFRAAVEKYFESFWSPRCVWSRRHDARRCRVS